MSNINTYLKNLHAERQRAWDEQKRIVDTAVGEKRDLTAEEKLAVARTDQSMDDLDEQINGWIDRADREKEHDAAREMYAGIVDRQSDRHGADGLTVQDRRFNAWLRDPNAGPAFDFELKAEANRRTAEKQRAIRVQGALGEDAAATGGNVTQSYFVKALYDYLESYSAIRRTRATVIPAPRGPTVLVPSFASHGTAVVTGEGTAIAGVDPTFGQTEIEIWKYGHLVRVSDELLEDSVVDLVDAIARDVGRGIARQQDLHFITGSGNGQPTGSFTVMGTAITGANGGTGVPSFDNLIDLVYSVNREYRDNGAQWVMRDSSAGYVRKIKDLEGQYVWQPGGRAGEPDTLLGYEVITSDNVPAIGTGVKCIAFGDWSSYDIVDVGAFRFQRSDQRYFDQYQTAFRGIMRTGADLVDLTGSIKAYRGGTA